MNNNIEEVIKEYKNNIENLQQYKSFTNDVREYNGYILKKCSNLERFENEAKWLKKLMKYNYLTPIIIGTYNQEIIIMEKIEGKSINDTDAREHLYSIGQLIANLHNIPIGSNINWKEIITAEYKEIKDAVKNVMEQDIYDEVTKFLEIQLEKLEISRISIIHRDIRPENVIYSNGEYYLLDLENMGEGDIEYDFTRILNLLNEKEIYQYEDFKNLIDGYKSINDINLSEEKWRLYNKFYAFRIYSRMLIGKLGRSEEYEKYLKNILLEKNDRVSKWIKKYNEEC